MSNKQILPALLQSRAPWYIVGIDVDVAKEEAHIFVDHQSGRLPCPTCGVACLIKDQADDRTWRHLDMLCPTHNIAQALAAVHERGVKVRVLSDRENETSKYITLDFLAG